MRQQHDDDLTPAADAIWGIAGWFLLTLAFTGPIAFFNPTRYTLIALGLTVVLTVSLGWMSYEIRRGNGLLSMAAGWLGTVGGVAALALGGFLWLQGTAATMQLRRGGALILLLLILPAMAKLALKGFFGYWVWRNNPMKVRGFDLVHRPRDDKSA